MVRALAKVAALGFALAFAGVTVALPVGTSEDQAEDPETGARTEARAVEVRPFSPLGEFGPTGTYTETSSDVAETSSWGVRVDYDTGLSEANPNDGYAGASGNTDGDGAGSTSVAGGARVEPILSIEASQPAGPDAAGPFLASPNVGQVLVGDAAAQGVGTGTRIPFRGAEAEALKCEYDILRKTVNTLQLSIRCETIRSRADWAWDFRVSLDRALVWTDSYDILSGGSGGDQVVYGRGDDVVSTGNTFPYQEMSGLVATVTVQPSDAGFDARWTSSLGRFDLSF